MTKEEQAQYISEKLMEDPEFKKAFVGAITDAVNEVVKVIKALQQELCGDAISRQAVLELVADYDLSMGQVVKGIHALPSVTVRQSGEWIPVSERLPEAWRYVNCTCHSLVDDREDWVIETCYVPQPKGSPYSDWGNIVMLNDGECEVVAWMYRDIPEPYKASPTDEEVEE